MNVSQTENGNISDNDHFQDPDCCVSEVGVLDSRKKINDRVKASTSATDTETPGLESKERNNKPVNCRRVESNPEYTSVDEKRFECSFCHRQWTHKGRKYPFFPKSNFAPVSGHAKIPISLPFNMLQVIWTVTYESI